MPKPATTPRAPAVLADVTLGARAVTLEAAPRGHGETLPAGSTVLRTGTLSNGFCLVRLVGDGWSKPFALPDSVKVTEAPADWRPR